MVKFIDHIDDFQKYDHISGLMNFCTVPTALIAPFVINTIGPRATMGPCSVLLSGLFVGVLFFKTWIIYLGAVISGKIVLISFSAFLQIKD